MAALNLLFLVLTLLTGSGADRDTLVPLIYDLRQPVLMVPAGFARDSVAVFGCESGWDGARVGRAGELGIAQLHPVHRQEMEALGLDFGQERDRLQFAVLLYERHGWRDWSCAGKAGD